MEDKCRDKCKLMRPKTPRVRDKWETRVNSCGPRQPEWETCVGDKWETVGVSVNSCGLRHPEWHPEWETSVGDKCGRQVGDKCKIMRP